MLEILSKNINSGDHPFLELVLVAIRRDSSTVRCSSVVFWNRTQSRSLKSVSDASNFVLHTAPCGFNSGLERSIRAGKPCLRQLKSPSGNILHDGRNFRRPGPLCGPCS